MENWAIAVGIGIAAALGVGAFLLARKPAGMGRALQVVAIVAAGGLAAAVAGAGLTYLQSSRGIDTSSDRATATEWALQVIRDLRSSLGIGTSSDRATATEQALQVIRDAPLVGLVLKENPALETRFREAIEAELRNPTKDGPLRTYVVGAEVRRDMIVPALRSADDATALKAIEAMQDFVRHLQVTDAALCKEFGLMGIQQPARLDSAGGTLFKRALAAQEQAYLNGKTRPATPQQISDDEVSRLLTEAGYTTDDFLKLAMLAQSSAANGCAIVVKLYAAPTRLPPQRGGILARYLLTVS
ncbi:MAG: hypothetical protein HYZ40_18480 [Rhodospirillales bacterium]|nr:hypothetical protein [Rhodospirillales bacterium]